MNVDMIYVIAIIHILYLIWIIWNMHIYQKLLTSQVHPKGMTKADVIGTQSHIGEIHK